MHWLRRSCTSAGSEVAEGRSAVESSQSYCIEDIDAMGELDGSVNLPEVVVFSQDIKHQRVIHPLVSLSGSS